MATVIKEPPFLDFGNAAELFANGLHDIEVHGSMARFVLYGDRFHNGERVRVPVFAISMPLDVIGDAIALTLRKLGKHVQLPEMNSRLFGADGKPSH